MKLLKFSLGITNFIVIMFCILVWNLFDILIFDSYLYSLIFLMINLLSIFFSILYIFLFVKNMTNKDISDEEFKFKDINKFTTQNFHKLFYILSNIALFLISFMIINIGNVEFLLLYFVFFIMCFFGYTYIDFLNYNILLKIFGYRLYTGIILNDTNEEYILLCKEKEFIKFKDNINNIKFVHFVNNIFICKS